MWAKAAPQADASGRGAPPPPTPSRVAHGPFPACAPVLVSSKTGEETAVCPPTVGDAAGAASRRRAQGSVPSPPGKQPGAARSFRAHRLSK